jgi:uncharacterized protein
MLPYRPHRLLKNGHLQTLMVGLVDGYLPPASTESIVVTTDDSEQLLVHEELGAPLSDSAPLVILVHGLGGDHTSPYLRRVAYYLRRRNLRVWRVDLRGSGLGLKMAWRPAHAGCSHDLSSIFSHARQLYPRARLVPVGFSLSGNILLKLLGELAAGVYPMRLSEANIAYALAVAPPLDLHDCANNMDRWSRKLYTRYYIKLLQQQAELKRSLWPQWRELPVDPATPIRSIRDFDSMYTAPLAGFQSSDHYYSQASSIPWLPKIRTPTEIILDRHDPIVTWHSFHKAEFDQQWVRFHHTKYGGHLGYFGLDDQGRIIRWMEYYVVQRIASIASPSNPH